MPAALVTVSITSLALGVLCALVITIDLLAGHPQKMKIMSVVWPITALWSGPLGLYAYFKYGRAGERHVVEKAERRGEEPPNKRQLSRGEGVKEAVKADFLSLTAWQVGMYGWMAIATFAIFGREIPKGSPVFWFMMQVAMLLGFLTSYPVNWVLLRKGVKEAM